MYDRGWSRRCSRNNTRPRLRSPSSAAPRAQRTNALAHNHSTTTRESIECHRALHTRIHFSIHSKDPRPPAFLPSVVLQRVCVHGATRNAAGLWRRDRLSLLPWQRNGARQRVFPGLSSALGAHRTSHPLGGRLSFALGSSLGFAFLVIRRALPRSDETVTLRAVGAGRIISTRRARCVPDAMLYPCRQMKRPRRCLVLPLTTHRQRASPLFRLKRPH